MPRALPPDGGVHLVVREFRLIPGGKPVAIGLDAPYRRTRGEWECTYHIIGLGRTRAGRGRGSDGLQALQSALLDARRALEPFAARLTWLGEPGELGLPLPVPDYFGGEFRRRVEALVEREVEAEGRRLKARALESAEAPQSYRRPRSSTQPDS
jgi:hypothetical protein